MKTLSWNPSAIALIIGLGLALPALSAGRSAHPSPDMTPVRAMTDDKCDAACDAASDKCAIEAGKDAAKQRDCDLKYDACLRACQGQN